MLCYRSDLFYTDTSLDDTATWLCPLDVRRQVRLYLHG